MKKSIKGKADKTLRDKAELKLKNKMKGKLAGINEADMQKLIYELEVHQIELEMQNEELLRAKDQAEQVIEKYTELYDFTPSGYLTLEENGKIIDCNLRGAEILGTVRSNLINRTFKNFISFESTESFNHFLSKIFETENRESCEIILIAFEKEPVYALISGIITRQEHRCLISVIDITERKKTEEAMIENQRLGAIGEMASAIAHDFNNSLQTISGNIELALFDAGLPQTTLPYLNSVKTIVKDAADRVQKLQQFGGKSLIKGSFYDLDLNKLIEDVIAQSRPLWKDDAEKKGINIKIVPHLGIIPKVYGNAGELRTVFFNIIKNSMEAMPDGGQITIKTENTKQGDIVTITDTGTGMSREIQSRVFQPFYTTKGFETGRGMGMSGAMAILKEHGGNIRVKYSEPGKGTVIEMIMPVVIEDIKRKHAIKKRANSSLKKIKKILWVEDDVLIREIARQMILRTGLACDFVENGKKALRFLECQSYDLVITDIGMPEMNGWQLADTIKAKYGEAFKVAVVSGWGLQIDEDDKKKHGISHVLVKPFTFAELRKMVQNNVRN